MNLFQDEVFAMRKQGLSDYAQRAEPLQAAIDEIRIVLLTLRRSTLSKTLA